jgi:flavodoxin
MKEIKLNELYDLSNLLCTFHEDTYYPERKDEDTIKRFVKEKDSQSIKDTIKEGKDVLELKPFPYEWISQVINASWETDDACKKWVSWMLKSLEEEGKKQGKLQSPLLKAAKQS